MFQRLLILGLLLACSNLRGAPPDWAVDAVWYQIFPERFRNGDPANDPTAASCEGTWPYTVPPGWKVSPWTSDWYELQPWEAANGKGFYHNAQLRRYGGDLQGIIDKLDYLQNLGVTALYLNPIFESPSLHKYGAVCYHHVDKHFGPDPKADQDLFSKERPESPEDWKWSAADKLFLKLIAETHRRGMKIIIDGVFNHVGINFWALQRARKEGPGSAFADWFHINRWDDPATPADEFDYKGWVGIKDLPEFNRDATNLHPAVREHLHAVVRRWMDPNGDGDPSDGIDGWRLDVAAEVPMGFWQEFRGWVKAINKDAYITGEIWWEDFDKFVFRNARPWLEEPFDGVMNYRFGDAACRFLNQPQGVSATQFGQLILAQHGDYGFSRCLALQNLYGSHDTARIGSIVVNPGQRQDHGAGVQDHRGYVTRKPSAKEKRRWKQLVAFQFMAPGAPYVYYGDEAGMWGADDPDCRKPMVWPDLNYMPEKTLPFGDTRQADEVSVDRDMFAFYQEWIARRRDLPVLRRGDFKIVLTDDERQLFAFRRKLGDNTIIAIFNAGDGTADLSINDLGVSTSGSWSDGGKPVAKVVSLEPHWFTFLQSSAK